MGYRIHVVEDSSVAQELLRVNLCMAGYEVIQSRDCTHALGVLQPGAVDLVLLDWNLPDVSGIELLQRIRATQALSDLPVLMLTGRTAEADKMLAFGAGADDYVTKPFHAREVLARVQSLLRRVARLQDSRGLEVDGLRIDADARRALAGGVALELSPIELRLLQYLLQRPAQVLTRERLIEGVWPATQDVSSRSVDACVARVRRQLDLVGHYPCIETVRAIGYRLVSRSEFASHG